MTFVFPPISKQSFTLAGERAHLLLIHGYTGTPYDLRPLGDFLNQKNMHVVAPLLKGHGTTASELYKTTAKLWINEIDSILKELDQTKPIIIGGLSMGALLAIILAAKHPYIKALLLFSPSLCLTLSAELIVTAASLGWISKQTSIKKVSGSDILDPIAKKNTPAYDEMPINGLLELEKLRLLAKEDLETITCPIFMAFGEKDEAINTKISHRMVLQRTTAPVFAKFYKNSKHVITLDYDKERLFFDVWQFLTSHLGL